MNETFKKNIKALRLREGLTQAQLAKQIGATTLTVLDYERGLKFPSRANIKEKLLIALNCTEQDLYGFSDGYYATHVNPQVDFKAGIRCTTKPKKSASKRRKGTKDNFVTDQTTKKAVDKDVLKRHPKGTFMQIVDDSMDKFIPQYSYCYITLDEDKDDYENKICALTIDGNHIDFRRINFMSFEDMVALIPQSNNIKYEVITLDAKKNEDFKIFGRVVWISKDFENI